MFNKWWIIAHSKNQFCPNNYLGNAAILNDKKPEFLEAIALWINNWEKQKILNCEKFVKSAQTSSAFKQTLHCHASLIENLLNDGYKFLMTTRFKSDPIERRFGQCRQMSSSRFLVSLKDVLCSAHYQI